MARQVIVPLDQSHVAECAVPYARALARRMKAPLELLSVVEPSGSLPEPPPEEELPPIEESPRSSWRAPYDASLPIGMNPGVPDLDQGQIEELTDQLKETEQYLTYVGDSISDVHVEKMVVYGNPVDQIVRVAASVDGIREESPVIVMASHGRSGLGRVLLGSVAFKVAERATSPMLIVRALRSHSPSGEDITLNKVLIALDGSRFSEAVLDPVRHVFGIPGTEIHLMRAIEHNERAEDEPQEAERYLAEIADRMTALGFTVTWETAEGNPADGINSVAEKFDVDVIALATHGYSGLKRLAIGSVAEDVLHKATRPMFMVRPEETHGARE
jgi:nucleotide-binding universal stress UspA family protein